MRCRTSPPLSSCQCDRGRGIETRTTAHTFQFAFALVLRLPSKVPMSKKLTNRRLLHSLRHISIQRPLLTTMRDRLFCVFGHHSMLSKPSPSFPQTGSLHRYRYIQISMNYLLVSNRLLGLIRTELKCISPQLRAFNIYSRWC